MIINQSMPTLGNLLPAHEQLDLLSTSEEVSNNSWKFAPFNKMY